jgi:hypothetical protein
VSKAGNSPCSALLALILAMMHHLCERDAQEIGEFRGHLNQGSSDFGPGKILRGLARRTPLPYGHHREHRHAIRPASPLPTSPNRGKSISHLKVIIETYFMGKEKNDYLPLREMHLPSKSLRSTTKITQRVHEPPAPMR